MGKAKGNLVLLHLLQLSYMTTQAGSNLQLYRSYQARRADGRCPAFLFLCSPQALIYLFLYAYQSGPKRLALIETIQGCKQDVIRSSHTKVLYAQQLTTVKPWITVRKAVHQTWNAEFPLGRKQRCTDVVRQCSAKCGIYYHSEDL